MAAESGRLLAGQGKRNKGRNKFHPSPNQTGIIHYSLQRAPLVLWANPPSPPPHVYTSRLFLSEWICERSSCLSCYKCTFNLPRSHVLVFSCLAHWPLLPLFAANFPLARVTWSAWVICYAQLQNLGDGSAWMFSILSSCQSLSHHWIHLNCWTGKRGPRSNAAPLCHSGVLANPNVIVRLIGGGPIAWGTESYFCHN